MELPITTERRQFRIAHLIILVVRFRRQDETCSIHRSLKETNQPNVTTCTLKTIITTIYLSKLVRPSKKLTKLNKKREVSVSTPPTKISPV